MSMPPTEFLTKAMVKGYRITVKGDSLAVVPPPGVSISDSFRSYVTAKKLELLKVLQAPKIDAEQLAEARQNHNPMELAQPHGVHDPMHTTKPPARGNPMELPGEGKSHGAGTYERSTPHKGASPHARAETPCGGGELEELGVEVETLLGMHLLCLASDEGRLPPSVFPSLICPSGRRVDNPAVAVRGMLQRSEVLAQGGRIGSKLAGADLLDWPFLAAWWGKQGA